MQFKVLCLVLSLSLTAAATSQHEVFTNAVPFASTTLDNVKGLNQDKATLDNPSAAKDFINAISSIPGVKNLPVVNGNNKDIYVLIHLLRWSDSSTATNLKAQADHWYLYRDVPVGQWSQEDLSSTKRLLGVKQVYVLYVHLNDGKGTLVNRTSASYVPTYDLTISKKTPANVAHLYALLASYTGGTTSQSGISNKNFALDLVDTTPYFVWGGGVVNLQYRPSDILIKSTFHTQSNDSDQKLADDITFDNEGPYWWDVGFAVPVKKISELKLDSTSGTATPASVNGQNVFSVLDIYLRPVDVKGSAFTAIPHPIAGIAFAKQPLHKILVGGAWGPKVSEIYAGVMFVKQPNLSGSNSCGSPSGTSFTGGGHFCAQFTIGINLAVSSIISKLGAPK
jgi:hypothetical protein